MSKQKYFTSRIYRYLKSLLLSIMALLLVVLFSTQIYAQSKKDIKLAEYATVSFKGGMKNIITSPKVTINEKNKNDWRWERNKVKLTILNSKNSAEVQFFKNNQKANKVTVIPPEKRGANEFGWPCNGQGNILKIDFKWKQGNKIIANGCAETGTTAPGRFKQLHKNLKSNSNKFEISQAKQEENEELFFCSAASESTGEWGFAISNPDSTDIFSRKGACYLALRDCREKNGGNKCDVTNFGTWETNKNAVAMIECSENIPFPEKTPSAIPGSEIKAKIEDIVKEGHKKELKYCVPKIFNKNQVSIGNPSPSVNENGIRRKISDLSPPATAIIADIEGLKDEAISVLVDNKIYYFYQIENGAVSITDNPENRLKFSKIGEENIVALSTHGNFEASLIKNEKYHEPVVEQGKAIILNVNTGEVSENIGFKAEEKPQTQIGKHPPGNTEPTPPITTRTYQGPGFLIDTPLNWKYVDNTRVPSNSVTSSFAIQQVRSKDPQLGNAYVDASFSKFYKQAENREFAQLLRKQITSYSEPPEKFIATDFQAALGVGKVDFQGSNFEEEIVKKFPPEIKNILESQSQPEKLSLGGVSPVHKFDFNFNLLGPNKQNIKMKYFVYLIPGSEPSQEGENLNQGSYYVINMMVREDLFKEKQYDEIFDWIAQSFRLS